MKSAALGLLLLCAGWLLAGCVPHRRLGCASPGSGRVESASAGRVRGLSAEVKTRILALNPEQVTGQEVRDLLSQAPAPRIISIHGGFLPIRTGMNSFARFLIGMGYPESSIRNPGNGFYTYGYYDRSDEIAGAVAWYYEQDGLRPVLVGHSQGGIQAIRVLHKLAGDSAATLSVWNPVTQSVEQRNEITDPLTGMPRPVVGVQVSYASAVVAGGLARLLPNEWDMNNKLRKIPDSVVEFTGFQKGLDPLGGDFLGYGPANDYRPTGSARVRNVRLPSASPHSTIPYTQSLLRRPEVRQWIDQYDPHRPGEDRSGPDSDPEWMNARILWAAEVWHSIKKHWVLELQRLIRAQRAPAPEPPLSEGRDAFHCVPDFSGTDGDAVERVPTGFMAGKQGRMDRGDIP